MAERSFTQGLIYGDSAGGLRHEDQDADWDGSGYRAPPRRFLGSHPRLRVGLFVALLGLCVLGFLYQHRRNAVVRAVQNRARAAETQMELTVVARVVRDFRISQGRYPADFGAFLARSLRRNKEFPPGRDFWGRPYQLEVGEEGFTVRSAGADGRYQTRDDLTCRATVRD